MIDDKILDAIDKLDHTFTLNLANYKEKSVIRKGQIFNLFKETVSLLRKEYLSADNEAEIAPIISFVLRIKGIDSPLFWENSCGQGTDAENVAKFLIGEYYEFMDAPAQYSMGMLSAETDLEDAINWVDGATFDGSEKQIKWAKDIAHKNLKYICELWQAGKQPSSSAKWWIENRDKMK